MVFDVFATNCSSHTCHAPPSRHLLNSTQSFVCIVDHANNHTSHRGLVLPRDISEIHQLVQQMIVRDGV